MAILSKQTQDKNYVLVEDMTVYVDSSKAYRNNGHDDDVDIDITTGVMECGEDEHIDVELLEFVCKRDFYSVQTYNSSFSIYYSGANHTYAITTGFPNVNNLTTELKTDLQTAFPTATWTVVYSAYTGKLTITGTQATTFPADLALNMNISNSAYRLLGFELASYPFTGAGTTSVSLSSAKPVNLQGEEAIYFRCSLVNKNKQTTAYESLVASDILGKMDIIVSPLNNIVFYTQALGMFRVGTTQKNLMSFNIRLTNEDNQLIGLNSNFQATLRFYKMRKADNLQLDYLRDIRDYERMRILKKDILSTNNIE